MTLEAITQKKDTGGYTPWNVAKNITKVAVQTIITLIESKIDELTLEPFWDTATRSRNFSKDQDA